MRCKMVYALQEWRGAAKLNILGSEKAEEDRIVPQIIEMINKELTLKVI